MHLCKYVKYKINSVTACIQFHQNNIIKFFLDLKFIKIQISLIIFNVGFCSRCHSRHLKCYYTNNNTTTRPLLLCSRSRVFLPQGVLPKQLLCLHSRSNPPCVQHSSLPSRDHIKFTYKFQITHSRKRRLIAGV